MAALPPAVKGGLSVPFSDEEFKSGWEWVKARSRVCGRKDGRWLRMCGRGTCEGKVWKGSKTDNIDAKVCTIEDAKENTDEDKDELLEGLERGGLELDGGGKVRWFEGEVKKTWGLRGGQSCVTAEGSLKRGDGDVLIKASVISRMSTMRRSTRSAVSVSRTTCRPSRG